MIKVTITKTTQMSLFHVLICLGNRHQDQLQHKYTLPPPNHNPYEYTMPSSSNSPYKSQQDKSQIKCFECGEMGHAKCQCPRGHTSVGFTVSWEMSYNENEIFEPFLSEGKVGIESQPKISIKILWVSWNKPEYWVTGRCIEVDG